MNQFKELTTAELDTLAVKTARQLDALRSSLTDRNGNERWTKTTHKTREKIAHMQRRLTAMDQELDRRHA